MKAFKTYGAAKKFAAGGPVLRVGDLYLAEPVFDPGYWRLLSIELIAPNDGITATITAHSLERLGNGNYAEAKRPYGGATKVFNPGMFK
jgi:hypothetical protein